MSGEARSSSCLAKGTRCHFRKFCAFARFVRRDVIMAMIIGSTKSDVFTSPSWGRGLQSLRKNSSPLTEHAQGNREDIVINVPTRASLAV